jgi:hypothetical protein
MFISIVLLTISCHCSKKTVDTGITTSLSTIEGKASQKYKGKYNLKLNSKEDFALVYQARKTRKNNPFPTIFFSVYNVNTGENIYNDVIPGGQVQWIDDYVIEIKSFIRRPKNIHNKNKLVLYKLNVKTHNRFK